MPLVGDIAPPEKRATSVAIVLSGVVFGVIMARTVSGVLSEFASWRM